MTHKVAIIKVHATTSYYDVDTITNNIICDSITEWDEISDDDFKVLKQATRYSTDFVLIEQPVNQSFFIAKTVKGFLAEAKIREEKRLADEKVRNEKNAAAKIKKDLKSKETKLKKLKKLQEELGNESTS